MKLQALIADDEPLARERLRFLLAADEEIEIAGECRNGREVIAALKERTCDVLFLDIQMPGMTGFDLLVRLPEQPFVIFTTAYDEYALRAFEVNSIDYLLKPIEPDQLERAIRKLERLRPHARPAWQKSAELPQLLHELAASLRGERHDYPRRIASRVGERITFLDLQAVTHFQSQDKLTYAIADACQHCVDQTIADLEQRLDPARFLRIHRAVLVNIDWIHQVNAWFAGKVVVTLKDQRHTQLPVARDRVRILKSRLGI